MRGLLISPHSRSCQFVLVAMLLVVVAPLESHAAIYRVNAAQTANCPQDGTTWGSAFRYLQDAIAEANNNLGPDIIWIAEGTYRSDETCDDPNGTGVREESFVLQDIHIFGGFPDDLTGLGVVGDRDPTLFVFTVLTGDLDGDDQPDFGNYDDNSYHVGRVDPGTDGESVEVDGVRITAGEATKAGSCGSERMGGGVLLDASTFGDNDPGPSFVNVTFDRNRAFSAGGGLAGRKMQVRLFNCLFELNHTFGLSVPQCPGEPQIANRGGGALSVGADLKMSNCRVLDNTSSGPAGGVDGGTFDFGLVTNCVFGRNQAGTQGGGAVISSGELVNCLFDENVALGNSGAGGGGGLFSDGDVTIYNCTFVENEAVNPATAEGGGAIVDVHEIFNCIFWDNTAPVASVNDSQLANVDPSQDTCPHFSDIEGFTSGGSCQIPPEGHGNIDENPKFVNPGADDYRIVNSGGAPSVSPCLEAGNPDQVDDECEDGAPPPEPGLIRCDTEDVDEDGDTSEPTPDLDLNIRVLGNIDMGAYEFKCIGDINGDGETSTADLLVLLSEWGACPDCENCPADLNGDCAVATADLLLLLGNWDCPRFTTAFPTTVAQCLQRYSDPAEQAACICVVEPCTEGCLSAGSCE